MIRPVFVPSRVSRDSFLVRIASEPPAGVNLAALRIRFQKTCLMRAGSANVIGDSAARSSFTAIWPAWMAGRQISTASRIAS